MDGQTVLRSLREMLSDLDAGRRLRRIQLKRVFAPIVAPAALGLVLTAGCPAAAPEPEPGPPADAPAVTMYGAPIARAELCGDGSDNDGDGLVDCSDPDCNAQPPCIGTPPPSFPSAVEPAPVEEYGAPFPGASVSPPSPILPSPQPSPVSPAAPVGEICRDGVDNDGDGLTDCADDECSGTAMCAPVIRYGAPFRG